MRRTTGYQEDGKELPFMFGLVVLPWSDFGLSCDIELLHVQEVPMAHVRMDYKWVFSDKCNSCIRNHIPCTNHGVAVWGLQGTD